MKGITTIATIGILFFASNLNAQLPAPIICQNKKCLSADQSVTSQYLYDNISNLLKKNKNNNTLLCEANPASKMCLQNGFAIPVSFAYGQTFLELSTAKLIDIKPATDETSSSLLFDYKIKSGDIFPNCQTAPSQFNVLSKPTVQMTSSNFHCSLSKSNPIPLNIIYDFDYIDFDTGTFGAYYTAHTGHQLQQSKNGYVLFRFMHPASIASTTPFPMPEVAQQFAIQQEEEKAHTHVDPIWMKPTPILDLENPSIVTNDCVNNPNDYHASQQQETPHKTVQELASSSTPSTTGLVYQDKKQIIPPVNGIKKTITTKKKIIENGKVIATTEEVRELVQQSPEQPFVETNVTLTQNDYQDEPSNSQTNNLSHSDLSLNNNLSQLDTVEQPITIDQTPKTSIGKKIDSLWSKFENYFYF